MSRASEDDVERGLLELVQAELGVRAAHATTLAELGLDELERGRFLHHVEERFARPVPDALLKGTTRVAELVEHLQRVSYWDYPRAPSGSGADMARADFGSLFVRPALQATAMTRTEPLKAGSSKSTLAVPSGPSLTTPE